MRRISPSVRAARSRIRLSINNVVASSRRGRSLEFVEKPGKPTRVPSSLFEVKYPGCPAAEGKAFDAFEGTLSNP